MVTRFPRPIKLPAALEREYAGIARPDGGEKDSVVYFQQTLEHWTKVRDLYSNVMCHDACARGLIWNMAYDAWKHAEEHVREAQDWLDTYGPKTEASK